MFQFLPLSNTSVATRPVTGDVGKLKLKIKQKSIIINVRSDKRLYIINFLKYYINQMKLFDIACNVLLISSYKSVMI
jgi:hypothetical protein